jgi:hypothetical protein
MHSERTVCVQYVVGYISLALSVTCCIASMANVIRWVNRGQSIQRRGLVMPEDVQDSTAKSRINHQLLHAVRINATYYG